MIHSVDQDPGKKEVLIECDRLFETQQGLDMHLDLHRC